MSQDFEPEVVMSPKVADQNYRNVSFNKRGINFFQEETYSQLDYLMNQCDETVPNLIGKIREVRTTNSHMIVPKGYTNQDIIGKNEA